MLRNVTVAGVLLTANLVNQAHPWQMVLTARNVTHNLLVNHSPTTPKSYIFLSTLLRCSLLLFFRRLLWFEFIISGAPGPGAALAK